MFAKIIALATLAVIGSSYPLYKQCDSRWGSDKLGTSGQTICQAGCLMSSVAMVIADCGRSIGGAQATPKTLNTFLRNNGGYVSGNLFVWGAVNSFGLGFVGKAYNSNDIQNHFRQGRAVILNVNNGGHWVLVTGISGSSYLVNDPGFARTSYGFGEVSEAGIYNRPAGCASRLQ